MKKKGITLRNKTVTEGDGEEEEEDDAPNKSSLSHARAIQSRKLRENAYNRVAIVLGVVVSTRPIKITICSMGRFACKLKGSPVFDCIDTFRGGRDRVGRRRLLSYTLRDHYWSRYRSTADGTL